MKNDNDEDYKRAARAFRISFNLFLIALAILAGVICFAVYEEITK